MTSTNIDYVATYFKFPEVDKIHGAPYYAKLLEIKDQIKASVSSISSELGGGTRGCLVLVSTNDEYASITATRYVHPTHPGPLKTPVLTAQRTVTRM